MYILSPGMRINVSSRETGGATGPACIPALIETVPQSSWIIITHSPTHAAWSWVGSESTLLSAAERLALEIGAQVKSERLDTIELAPEI